MKKKRQRVCEGVSVCMWRRSWKLPRAKPRVKMAGFENSLLVEETGQNNKSKCINLNSLSVLVNAWTNSRSSLWHPTQSLRRDNLATICSSLNCAWGETGNTQLDLMVRLYAVWLFLYFHCRRPQLRSSQTITRSTPWSKVKLLLILVAALTAFGLRLSWMGWALWVRIADFHLAVSNTPARQTERRSGACWAARRLQLPF